MGNEIGALDKTGRGCAGGFFGGGSPGERGAESDGGRGAGASRGSAVPAKAPREIGVPPKGSSVHVDREEARYGNVGRAQVGSYAPRHRLLSDPPDESESDETVFWEHLCDAGEGGGFTLEVYHTLAEKGIPTIYRRKLWSAVTRTMRARLAEVNPQMWDVSHFSVLRQSCADASEAAWEQLGPIADAGGSGDKIIERLVQDHIRHAGAEDADADVMLPAAKLGVWKATLSQLVCDMKRNPILLGMDLDLGDRRRLEARVVGLAAAACVHAPNGAYMQGMDALMTTLLRNMNDCDAFWAFMILCNITLAGYFDASKHLLPLQLEIGVFQELFATRLPSLHNVFAATCARSMNIPNDAIPNSIATRLNVWDWYIKCYAGRLPEAAYMRVWDLFFSRMAQGRGALVVIHAVSLAIFGTLGSLIQQRCENVHVSDEATLDTVTKVIEEFMGEEHSLLLSETEATRFHEDVMNWVFELEKEGAYEDTRSKVQMSNAFQSLVAAAERRTTLR